MNFFAAVALLFSTTASADFAVRTCEIESASGDVPKDAKVELDLHPKSIWSFAIISDGKREVIHTDDPDVRAGFLTQQACLPESNSFVAGKYSVYAFCDDDGDARFSSLWEMLDISVAAGPNYKATGGTYSATVHLKDGTSFQREVRFKDCR